jgi:hypothetical protein
MSVLNTRDAKITNKTIVDLVAVHRVISCSIKARNAWHDMEAASTERTVTAALFNHLAPKGDLRNYLLDDRRRAYSGLGVDFRAAISRYWERQGARFTPEEVNTMIRLEGLDLAGTWMKRDIAKMVAAAEQGDLYKPIITEKAIVKEYWKGASKNGRQADDRDGFSPRPYGSYRRS